MNTEVILTRGSSVAEAIERLIGQATTSVDAALYRFNNPRLKRALGDAIRRGVRVRLVLDRNKYEESRTTQELFAGRRIPLRLLYGRQGPGTKMHHKFAILDGRKVLSGSYNWTLESEEQNYEGLLALCEPEQVNIFQREFEALWAEASPPLL
jgi:phosphatidylserine/phosphatidylglycerophosphate/cardiolipin synthase-like enzyme